MSDNRRAPDIHHRLLDLHAQQRQQRKAAVATSTSSSAAADANGDAASGGEEGSSSEDDEGGTDLSSTFLSPLERHLSRVLGCVLTVTLSDQRVYCGRLYCLDRMSLLLSDAVQRLNQQQPSEPSAALGAVVAEGGPEPERDGGQCNIDSHIHTAMHRPNYRSSSRPSL